ncbi:hypothetical protein CLV51_103332 [Chitinophaga niastensis]|uniref:Uncharacterized protein n=1 Tax=Chitinophaga niastensis TaxID=536980 RepID=A0A2P8HJF4_CHINA|nr:hypothetical protein [Chitinophaga niastensis]PSL46354.1 hypothetical protein CLV51_103332 [Chitinophaga niastensis]
MIQQDLIDLIGLKVTDEKLIAFFNKHGLKQPKSCTPNNAWLSVDDKANNVTYSFAYKVIRDGFYPYRKEGRNWVTYLTRVGFVNESTIRKKKDTKPDSFWNVSPNPQTPMNEMVKHFDRVKHEEAFNYLHCEKDYGPDKKICVQYNTEDDALSAYWVKLEEHREVFAHFKFKRGEYDYDIQLHGMIIKWLFDNQYLALDKSVYENPLPNNTEAVLTFVQDHLKGRLFDNQLSATESKLFYFLTYLRSAKVFETATGEGVSFYLPELATKAAGIYDTYQAARSNSIASTDDIIRTIVFDDAHYAAFSKALTENYTLFKTLIAALKKLNAAPDIFRPYIS